MSIHIITPFSREENLNFYINNLKNKNIIWHPLFHDKFYLEWFSYNINWIEPIYNIKLEEGVHPNICKLNLFIKEEIIVDEDYYIFMNDDDWIEDDVFDRLRKMDDNIIYCAMKRGYQIPDTTHTHHGISTLVPYKGVKPGEIGLEQIILKGKILKEIEFENEGMFDGLMAHELQQKYDVTYIKDMFMLFNYLEEGRWNKIEEENKNMEKILDRFERSKLESRDISEHLNTLYNYATKYNCDVIVELGTNEGISTTAFALAVKNFPEKELYCYYYIAIRPYFQELLNMCENEHVEINFILGDSRKVEIPECDLLFCDTLHVYEQLRDELKLHAPRTRKYIIMHDTQTFAFAGVVPNSEGLKKAVDEFLLENKDDWKFKEHFKNNNGLTVLERIK